jgi:hypothetical protein
MPWAEIVAPDAAGGAFRGKVRDGVKRNCPQWTVPRNPNINIVEVDWSDWRIAEACGVGNQLVGVVRSELQLCDSHSCQTLKRIGRDGKARSTPTPRESRGWTAPEVAQAKERQIEGGKSKVPQQSGEPISGVDKRDLDTDHRLAKEAGQ